MYSTLAALDLTFLSSVIGHLYGSYFRANTREDILFPEVKMKNTLPPEGS